MDIGRKIPVTCNRLKTVSSIEFITKSGVTQLFRDWQKYGVIISHMDIAHKIGQMIMVGFDGANPDRVSKLITDLHLGGIILFSRNIDTREQARSLTSSLQNVSQSAGLPKLLVSIDQEGGSTTRLGHDICPEFPTNRHHGDHYRSTGDLSPVIEQAKITAGTLLDLGINMNLAPVVDVVTVDGNEVIGSRSYGSDSETVSALGSGYIKELQKNGVIATAKHFPGHGPTRVDSHKALPSTSISRADAENVHMAPFRRAIDSGVDAIMTAHIVYESFDSLPATLSHELLTNQLRNRMGFQGIIITDDMNMLAIADNFGVEDAMVRTINAGVDILLICKNEETQRRAFNAVLDGVNSGAIEESTVDRAYYRISSMKRNYGMKHP